MKSLVVDSSSVIIWGTFSDYVGRKLKNSIFLTLSLNYDTIMKEMVFKLQSKKQLDHLDVCIKNDRGLTTIQPHSTAVHRFNRFLIVYQTVTISSQCVFNFYLVGLFPINNMNDKDWNLVYMPIECHKDDF